ncbi:MAG TPA: DUF4198 domain-containing protein [Ramlibacter sp.]|nr:DUF4198 domain-containing protein [Ramlibacter sp.]
MNAAAAAWLALALALAGPAAAHDSWLAPAEGGGLALRTGNRYPVAESGASAASVGVAGCVDAGGRRHALRAAAETPAALQLRTEAREALACWVELKEHEVTLAPALVERYLREIRPGDQVRAAWADQQERGLPWVERYRKFARIEQGTQAAGPEVLRRLRAPAGLPLEIVIDSEAPLQVGQTTTLRVLADGRPVAGLSLELVSERSAVGVWARSDAQGRLQFRLPFAGQWLVRGTLLDSAGEGRWRSRFVTLVFEAG